MEAAHAAMIQIFKLHVYQNGRSTNRHDRNGCDTALTAFNRSCPETHNPTTDRTCRKSTYCGIPHPSL